AEVEQKARIVRIGGQRRFTSHNRLSWFNSVEADSRADAPGIGRRAGEPIAFGRLVGRCAPCNQQSKEADTDDPEDPHVHELVLRAFIGHNHPNFSYPPGDRLPLFAEVTISPLLALGRRAFPFPTPSQRCSRSTVTRSTCRAA